MISIQIYKRHELGFLTEAQRHGGEWAEKKVSIQTKVLRA